MASRWLHLLPKGVRHQRWKPHSPVEVRANDARPFSSELCEIVGNSEHGVQDLRRLGLSAGSFAFTFAVVPTVLTTSPTQTFEYSNSERHPIEMRIMHLSAVSAYLAHVFRESSTFQKLDMTCFITRRISELSPKKTSPSDQTTISHHSQS